MPGCPNGIFDPRVRWEELGSESVLGAMWMGWVSWRDGLGTLEKGPLECGLSKPIMGFQSPSWAFVSRKMAQKSGGHFSEKKKAPAATYPQVQGFQKSGTLKLK